jgi:hypothetical protein
MPGVLAADQAASIPELSMTLPPPPMPVTGHASARAVGAESDQCGRGVPAKRSVSTSIRPGRCRMR